MGFETSILKETRQETRVDLQSVQEWYKLYSTEDIIEFIEKEEWKMEKYKCNSFRHICGYNVTAHYN
jgi:hypothetical protein